MLLSQCITFMFMFLVDGKCLGHLDESRDGHQQANKLTSTEPATLKYSEGMIYKNLGLLL